MNAQQVIDDILRREGGYVNHSADHGGPTNHGITQATLSAWRKAPASIDDVRNLTEAEAREIYESEYVRKPGFDRVNGERLQAILVDCAVNHGPDRAVKFLQGALGVTQDGDFGPKTRGALYNSDPVAIYRKVVAARARFYGQIITKNVTQAVFAAGWMNRLAEFIEA